MISLLSVKAKEEREREWYLLYDNSKSPLRQVLQNSKMQMFLGWLLFGVTDWFHMFDISIPFNQHPEGHDLLGHDDRQQISGSHCGWKASNRNVIYWQTLRCLRYLLFNYKNIACSNFYSPSSHQKRKRKRRRNRFNGNLFLLIKFNKK